MEKGNLFMSDDNTPMGSYEQLQNCFFNPNLDNNTNNSDPFESALSSMVSSPITIPNNSSGGDNFVLRELIGRLGSICNSREMSPNSYNMNNNNSTNNSCYSTPLNSPPKLNLSMMGNLPPTQFTTDPGFAERAARFSCFATNMESGQLSRVSSNHSIKIQEFKDVNLVDSRENSSVSEQIIDTNSRKRKSISKGKSTKIANVIYIFLIFGSVS